ncbi:MAG: energy transducer TonB [Burkholderiales bacterium]
MWISWLLKYDGYPPGVVVALLLHGLLLYIFLPKDFDPANQVRVEPASFVVASAVKQSPQQRRRIEQAQTQQRNAEAERQRQAQQRQREAAAEQQRQADAEKQKRDEAERQRVAEANRQQQVQEERERQAEAERQRAAEAERQRQLTAQREAEAAAAAAQNAANQQQQSAEADMVSQYVGIIRNLISGAWNRPPSARNGMLATVQLRLTPTGEIVSRDIVQSSGNADFDRSVLQAVDRVGSFDELKGMPTAVFERNFRRPINLEFTPEDLLR